MKICVINGSPKGQYSITLQTFLYIQKHNPQIEVKILDVGAKIRFYEKDFSEVINAINEAKLVLFSYPVYTFAAPYQLHRFIELLKDANLDLSEKFATQITTSKHFYDITAHNYIRDNVFDLGMKFIQGLSADMEDLLSSKGQKQSLDFWKYVEHCVTNNIFVSKTHMLSDIPKYTPLNIDNPKSSDKKAVIITNMASDDTELAAMIDDFKKYLPYNSYIVNINDFKFQGGCLGCFKCATDGQCVYTDGFADFLRNNIQTADAMVYAFSVKDHSMGASFKIYDDRQFCNGHRTVTMGTPCAYIINGDYQNETNLQMLVQGRAEVGQNYLAGVITDSTSLQTTINNLAFAMEQHYCPPQNFLGVGGMKIFRDLIYVTGGMMKADYKFYKKKGFFKDMPHKQHKSRLLMKLVGAMLANKKLVKKMGNKMTEGMLAPYKKVIEKK